MVGDHIDERLVDQPVDRGVRVRLAQRGQGRDGAGDIAEGAGTDDEYAAGRVGGAGRVGHTPTISAWQGRSGAAPTIA